MNPGDLPPDLFSPWEGAVAFRLFADQTDPGSGTDPGIAYASTDVARAATSSRSGKATTVFRSASQRM